MPGRSVAGVRLQAEAVPLVLREANGIAMRGNCEEPAFLVDSSVTKARLPGKPWSEVVVCVGLRGHAQVCGDVYAGRREDAHRRGTLELTPT